MEIRCRNCGHRWESEKDSLADFASEPRCSECSSRDVIAAGDADADDDEPAYAEAFRRFEAGDSPLDLVRDGFCAPQEARAFREEFNDLAGSYQLLAEDELEELRREAFERGREKGKRDGQQQMESRVQQREQAAYQAGYSQALRQTQFFNQWPDRQTM